MTKMTLPDYVAAMRENKDRGAPLKGIVPGIEDPVLGWDRAGDPTVKIATAILAGFAANPAEKMADAYLHDEDFCEGRAIENYVAKSLNIAQMLLTQNAERETDTDPPA